MERFYGQAKWSLETAIEMAGGFHEGASANLKNLAQAVDTQLGIELGELPSVTIAVLEYSNPNDHYEHHWDTLV